MQGRVVLVTGAARGTGREVARQLAERGATVLVSTRDADHARAAAEELSPGGAAPRRTTLSNDATSRSMAQSADPDGPAPTSG